MYMFTLVKTLTNLSHYINYFILLSSLRYYKLLHFHKYGVGAKSACGNKAGCNDITLQSISYKFGKN